MGIPSWPEMHGALTHFPVAMLIAAAVFEIGAFVFKRPEGRLVSFWMLAAAVGMAIPSLIAGWMTGRDMFGASPNPPAEFVQHRLMAFLTSSVALVLLLWRVKARDRLTGSAMVASVMLLLVSAGAVGFTGYLGGKMVFGGWVQPENERGRGQEIAEHSSSEAKPSTADPRMIESGRTLFQGSNCLSCHRMDGKGGIFGPDLTHEAQRNSRLEWQIEHLKDPAKVHPGSAMPGYGHLKPDELNALASYLVARQ